MPSETSPLSSTRRTRSTSAHTVCLSMRGRCSRLHSGFRIHSHVMIICVNMVHSCREHRLAVAAIGCAVPLPTQSAENNFSPTPCCERVCSPWTLLATATGRSSTHSFSHYSRLLILRRCVRACWLAERPPGGRHISAQCMCYHLCERASGNNNIWAL